MPLEHCFVGALDHDAFVWLGAKPRAATVRPGGHVAIMLRLDAPSRLLRLMAWLTMPFRIAVAERRILRSGATPAARIGLWPDTQAPTFVWHLEGPASAYADAQLLPPPSAPLQWIRRAAPRFQLCHPSVAAVIVIGTVR